MSGEVKLWDIRGSDRAIQTWEAFPGGLAAFDVHEQCGVFTGYGHSYPWTSVAMLTKFSQTFCPVILELADSARRRLFNTTLEYPFHCEHEHGLDNVSNPRLPISIYTTVGLHCISPN
jgi:hypothetical protein